MHNLMKLIVTIDAFFQIILEAEAQAEAVQMKGEAEAFAIEAKANAEAEQMQKKADAWKDYQEAAMVDMVLSTLPKVSLRFLTVKESVIEPFMEGMFSIISTYHHKLIVRPVDLFYFVVRHRLTLYCRLFRESFIVVVTMVQPAGRSVSLFVQDFLTKLPII